MRSIVKTGKTVDEAVNDALVELNCSLEDVTIEILEEPKSGFLGLIGSRSAVVRVSSKSNEFEDLINDTKRSLQDQLLDEEETLSPTEVVAVKSEPEVAIDEEDTKEFISYSSEDKQETVDQPDVSEVEPVQPAPVRSIEPKMEEDISPVEEPAPLDVEEEKEPVQTVKEENRSADEPVLSPESSGSLTGQDLIRLTEDWLNQIMQEMHIQASARGRLEENDNIMLDIEGISDIDTGIIIGRRAETIDALQYVLSIILNRQTDEHYRLFLDVGGYRDRRKASIEKMAKRNAEKVRKYRKPIALEAMNAYERRIVHTALQGMDHIVTISEGRDPHRKVIIRYGN